MWTNDNAKSPLADDVTQVPSPPDETWVIGVEPTGVEVAARTPASRRRRRRRPDRQQRQTPATDGDHSFAGFLTGIFPDNFFGAFTSGQLLQVVILAVIFGAGLLTLKPTVLGKIQSGLDTVSEAFFGFINVIMKLAPIGAFGAIAFSVGTNGSAMLLALAQLVLEYWAVVALFVTVVLGLVCLIAASSASCASSRSRCPWCWVPPAPAPMCNRARIILRR